MIDNNTKTQLKELLENNPELYADCENALEYWLTQNRGHVSIVSAQRVLKIGFNRAGRIIDALSKLGLVQHDVDSLPSENLVLISLDEFCELFQKNDVKDQLKELAESASKLSGNKEQISLDRLYELFPINGVETQLKDLVENNPELYDDCKNALKYWLTQNRGYVSIASAQMGLKIGFSRAGRIIDTLLKLDLINYEGNSLSDRNIVLISLDDFYKLFPNEENN